MKIATLKRRVEFQRVRGGARWSATAFLMESRPRPSDEAISGARFGFTATKKLGNAVARNRIRRRLREALRRQAVEQFRPDSDYVVIARSAARDQPFEALVADMAAALTRIRSAKLPPARPGKRNTNTPP
jgi:ribonuclease P protein component